MDGLYRFFANHIKPMKLFKTGIILFSSFALFAVAFLNFFEPKTDISNLKTGLERPTEIYDAEGKLASKISANKTEGVPIEEIPKEVKNAVLAIEDHRFYEHNGVDYKGIARAFYTNLKAGEIVQGGSTITQQLTKTALLDTDRTYKRKFEEFFLAREVEKEFSKDEILEMYLNQIYFGHGSWGIQKASRIYFGKEVTDLSISEAAMLAGLIKAPTNLDPFNHYDKAVQRRNTVLSKMKSYQFITKEDYEAAAIEKITLNKEENGDPYKGKFPYYVDHVLTEASKEYKIELDELLTGGYKVYTALDQKMQQATEEVYKEDSNFPKGTNDEKTVQSGTVLLDPKTGGIKALVGGRGEHQLLGYNRATQLKAPPGSTMKPLAVFTPAIEEGYGPGSMLKDEKMDFGGYEPENINDQYRGEVPLYEALMKSLNVPTVWLLNEIGIQTGMDAAERFGIPLTEKDRKLGLALGGLEDGVAPIHMAGAFSAFANNGERINPHAIVKIVDSSGNEVAAWKEKKAKVTSKSVAKKMITMLLGVVEQGTGKNAQVEGWEIAGKTGSTQVPFEGYEQGVKDQWFVGFTPTLVGAVWAGYDKTDKTSYLTSTSSTGAAILFQRIMDKALEGQKPVSFDVPDIDTVIKEHEKDEKKREREEFWNDQKEKVERGWQKFKGSLKKEDSQKQTNPDQESEIPEGNKPAEEEGSVSNEKAPVTAEPDGGTTEPDSEEKETVKEPIDEPVKKEEKKEVKKEQKPEQQEPKGKTKTEPPTPEPPPAEPEGEPEQPEQDGDTGQTDDGEGTAPE
ncbi:PBP1A family penicillin-binding protein [Peribacillus saganii]|uniref:PBP1A family penicillin-binding protein n=1 Tax=Peribacillus saganii TaxID=2303992 RepID=A0A372LR23_9BACI|nr:PBP1A family penicillin-binding protein [Peribacillus saganii]RFU70648.1 PBP1A family penicillin-binding protein [Peribacillus saganii]